MLISRVPLDTTVNVSLVLLYYKFGWRDVVTIQANLCGLKVICSYLRCEAALTLTHVFKRKFWDYAVCHNLDMRLGK